MLPQRAFDPQSALLPHNAFDPHKALLPDVPEEVPPVLLDPSVLLLDAAVVPVMNCCDPQTTEFYHADDVFQTADGSSTM